MLTGVYGRKIHVEAVPGWKEKRWSCSWKTGSSGSPNRRSVFRGDTMSIMRWLRFWLVCRLSLIHIFGAALLGRHLGYGVFLSDKGKLAEAYRDELITHRIAFEEGQHSMDRIFAAELVVKSPGIPDTVPMVVALRERGIEVISEIEFAGRHTEAKMVCITGSNGKTTRCV